MKNILRTLCFFLFYGTAQALAQTDSTRYAEIAGTYTMTTPTSPVHTVTILLKDGQLTFKASAQQGLLTPAEEGKFHFANENVQGTISFKKDEHRDMGILIEMNGKFFEGIKKETNQKGNPKQR